jgi:hypothetical protein
MAGSAVAFGAPGTGDSKDLRSDMEFSARVDENVLKLL